MPNWESIEVIGFDLDNTLYPVTPEIDEVIQNYIHEQSAAILGIDFDEAKRRFDSYYRGGQGLSGGKTLAAMGVQSERDIVQDALERADVASTLSPDPELVQFIDDLSQSFRSVDLLTGSSAEQTYAKIKALGLIATQFGLIITADDLSKSTGEAYQAWLDHYHGLSAASFLYVGDRKRVDSDIPAELGIATALVNTTAEPTAATPVYPDLASFGYAVLSGRSS